MKNLILKDIGPNTNTIVESMNVLKTNIALCGGNVQAIALTSCLPGEGKSSIAFELAKSLTQGDNIVLLIDADIRKSRFLRTRGAWGADLGLTHFLSAQAKLKEVIYKLNIKNLYFIPTGPTPPNPAELIENERFKRMIESSRKVFDYIVVDAAPIGAVIDAAIIAKHCDGVVMVVEKGKISRRMIGHAVKQMKRTNTRILGAVMNKVDVKSSRYYYSYYKEDGD